MIRRAFCCFNGGVRIAQIADGLHTDTVQDIAAPLPQVLAARQGGWECHQVCIFSIFRGCGRCPHRATPRYPSISPLSKFGRQLRTGLRGLGLSGGITVLGQAS